MVTDLNYLLRVYSDCQTEYTKYKTAYDQSYYDIDYELKKRWLEITDYIDRNIVSAGKDNFNEIFRIRTREYKTLTQFSAKNITDMHLSSFDIYKRNIHIKFKINSYSYIRIIPLKDVNEKFSLAYYKPFIDKMFARQAKRERIETKKAKVKEAKQKANELEFIKKFESFMDENKEALDEIKRIEKELNDKRAVVFSKCPKMYFDYYNQLKKKYE